MRLNELRDNVGATRTRTRVGRGKGSGKGKTCGHGQKGQKSRSGVAIKGFEGGQMPVHMRLPKRGFNPHNRKSYAVINLGRLQKAIDDKKLDASNEITADALKVAGLIRSAELPVRLLATGVLTAKIHIRAHHASKQAIELVKKVGGVVDILDDQVKSA